MTGNNSTPGEKLRAIFLAALMVGSVFALGVSLSGTAAAANASVSPTTSSDTVAQGGSATPLALQYSDDSATADGELLQIDSINLTKTGGNLTASSVNKIELQISGTTIATAGSISDLSQVDFGKAANSFSSGAGSFSTADPDGDSQNELELTDQATETIDVVVFADSGASTGDYEFDATTTLANTPESFSGSDTNTESSGTFTVDATPPEVDFAFTKDRDNDGQVDAVEVSFTENVDFSSADASKFSVSLNGNDIAVSGKDSSYAKGIDIDLDTTDPDLPDIGTDITPEVTVQTGAIDDSVGNTGPSSETTVTAGDGAAPVLVSATTETVATANTGEFDGAVLRFSEPITDTNGEAVANEDLKYNNNGGDDQSNTAGTGNYGSVTHSVGSEVVVVTLDSNDDAFGSTDTGTDTVEIVNANLQDSNDNGAIQFQTSAVTLEDGLAGIDTNSDNGYQKNDDDPTLVGDEVNVVSTVDDVDGATVSATHLFNGNSATLSDIDGDGATIEAGFQAGKTDAAAAANNEDETLINYTVNGVTLGELDYSTQNYIVEVTDEVTINDTTTIEGRIEDFPGQRADDVNINVGLYPADVTKSDTSNAIADGDTGDGTFSLTETFGKSVSSPNRDDLDYPANGSQTPSYEVFVEEDLGDTDSNIPNSGSNDGSDFIRTVLNVTNNYDSAEFGDTRAIGGFVQDALDSGVSGYTVEIRDPEDGAAKVKDADTAQTGEYTVNVEFNDAGNWTLETNEGAGLIEYDELFVDSTSADVSISTNNSNKGDFPQNYTIQVTDSDGDPLQTQDDDDNYPDTDGYLNVTGPFEQGSITNLASDGDVVNVPTEAVQDVDGDDADEVAYFHVETNADGYVTVGATPAGGPTGVSLENAEDYDPAGNNGETNSFSNPGDIYGGVEVISTGGTLDTPDTPDFVGDASEPLADASQINVVNFNMFDYQTDNPASASDNSKGTETDILADDGSEIIKALPLATDANDRIEDGARLGSDTFAGFDDMTIYRAQIGLRNASNQPIVPGTADGQVASIEVDGVNIDGTITANNDTNNLEVTSSENGNLIDATAGFSDGFLNGDDQHAFTIRPTQSTVADDELTIKVNVSGTGNSVDLNRSIDASALYIPTFEVDGNETDAVSGDQEANVTAVVRDKQENDDFINNGRVRVAQTDDSSSGTESLGNLDARLSDTNINNGQYEFEDIEIGPRGIDTDGDGIAEEASELVFTAYQYADADASGSIDRYEVDESTVKTLDLQLDRSLNVTFLPDNASTSEYVERIPDSASDANPNGQMALTRGVEYDSIAFTLTDGGNAVDLTEGMNGQTLDLNSDLTDEFVNVTRYSFSGQEVSSVTFDESESRPDDGFYVIEDIEGQDVIQSDNGGTADETDGVFSFDDFTSPYSDSENKDQFAQAWLSIKTPDLSKATEAPDTGGFSQSEGEFQVVDPNVDTNVTAVAGPGIDAASSMFGELSHSASDTLVDLPDGEVTELTIGVDRTYRVNGTYETFNGTPIDTTEFTRAFAQFDGPTPLDGADVSVTGVDSLGNSRTTLNGQSALDLSNSSGTFQYDIVVNTSGGDGFVAGQQLTMTAVNASTYGVSSGSAPTQPPSGTVNETEPSARNPLVEVYDESGSELPEDADTGNDILANSIKQTLRVEAFPSDADDEPLRGGLKFGFRNTNPISQNIVGTTTSTNASDQPLVTNRIKDLEDPYDVGQIGFLTLTPTGTGDAIIQLINDNDGTGTTVQNITGSDVVFDVLRSNKQVTVDVAQDSVVSGESVNATVFESGSPTQTLESASVSLVNSDGNIVTSELTDENGEVSLVVPDSASPGTYTVETGPAGFAPNETEVSVLPQATISFNDQTTEGSSVTVDAYAFGGNGEALGIWTLDSDGNPDEVLGSVTSPESGTGVEITLDTPVSENQTLVAAIHNSSDVSANNVIAFDTASITVESSDGPTLPNASGPAQDTDGDGQYEDVNGDGEVNLFDALDFYNSADSDAVQNNPAAFDFDASGDINGLFDALALWNEISA